MTLNEWITQNYNGIMLMSKRICKGNVQYADVAHYVIADFLENVKAEGLIERREAMSYMSGAIWRSFNSSTSPYHTLYREKGRVHSLHESYDVGDTDSLYDYDRDLLTEEIEGVLVDMEVEGIELWYIATIFKMYIREGNYSEIARKTGIPRTSISHAVGEAKEYIKAKLKQRGFEWN